MTSGVEDEEVVTGIIGVLLDYHGKGTQHSYEARAQQYKSQEALSTEFSRVLHK
jgi:hypothetical protein